MTRTYPRLLSLFLVIALLTSCGKPTQTEVAEEGYDPEARLAELGITLPSPPQPVANYVNGVRTGNLIFLAGKGPKRADGSELTGKLGADVIANCAWHLYCCYI